MPLLWPHQLLDKELHLEWENGYAKYGPNMVQTAIVWSDKLDIAMVCPYEQINSFFTVRVLAKHGQNKWWYGFKLY